MEFTINCPTDGCNNVLTVETRKAVNKVVTVKCNKCGKEHSIEISQFEKSMKDLLKSYNG